MKTEHGNTEGHKAVLTLHRGAYMGRTRLCGNSARIHHTHHRAIQPSHTTTTTDVIPAVTQCRKKSSVTSTLISYPGKATDNEVVSSDAIEKRFVVKPLAVPTVDIGKARPLSSKVKRKYSMPSDLEDEPEREHEGR